MRYIRDLKRNQNLKLLIKCILRENTYRVKSKKKWREDETNLLFWAIEKISKHCSLSPSQLVID